MDSETEYKKDKTLAGGCIFLSFLKFFLFPEIWCAPDGGIHIREVCPESGESLPRHPEMPANGRNTATALQHRHHLRTVRPQYIRLRIAAIAAAELDPLCLAQCQSLFRPHGYQIPLDLRHETESETQDLAVYGIVESVAFFRGIEKDASFQTFPHDGHDLRESPAQP